MKNLDIYLPNSRAEALDALSKASGARLKSGGSDLLGLLKHGLTEPKSLVDISRVGELSGVQTTASGRIHIGATTTLTEVAEHEALKARGTAIQEAASRVATPLVRNRATVGGNLCQRPRCWYFRHPEYNCSKKGGDTCYAAEGENKYHAIFENVTCNIVHPSNLAPALWALNGRIHVDGKKGAEEIPVDQFFVLPEEDISTEVVLDPDQLVTGISFQGTSKGAGSWYLETREKQSYDWALTCCATHLQLDGNRIEDARVVVSAVAPVPLRREESEAVLKGQTFSEELAWKAADAAIQDATPLRDNKYKIRLLRSTVAHTIIEAAARAKGGR